MTQLGQTFITCNNIEWYDTQSSTGEIKHHLFHYDIMAEMLVIYKLPKFYSPHSKTPVIFQIIMDTF